MLQSLFDNISVLNALSGIVALTAMGAAMGWLLSFALKRYPVQEDSLVLAVNQLLPQTQCAQCGHPGCKPYAEAVVAGEPINRCPPGGAATIIELANLLGLEPIPLDETFGIEQPETVAVIREAECIGCTLCIQACPVDAIIGAAQFMHVVIADQCTGCDLCLEPCPVDCIDMIEVDGQDTTLPNHLLRPIKPQLVDETACIRCGDCEPVCPQALQPQALFWHRENSEAMANLNLNDCIECMLCDRACPSHIPLTRRFAETKQRIRLEVVAEENALVAEHRYKQHTERQGKLGAGLKTRASRGDRVALLDRLKQAKS